jgi:hypothetical protein
VIDAIIKIVGTGLQLLGAVAPSVAQAFTGGRDVEEAIADAKKAASELPVREADGTWDRDLADRMRRG